VGKRFKPSDNIFHMVVRSKAGISPVVATVILVAVAIVIAIAVAFWASGLVGVFTRFEKIEIQSAYWDQQNNQVVVIARNTGSSPTKIDMLMVNGVPCEIDDIPLDIGQATNPPITFDQADCPSLRTGGVTNEIALHTTTGKTYPVAVLIP
jgi:archaeal type IV pilus assembly protein PilA